MERIDMWTLGCKVTECDAECTETSSRFEHKMQLYNE